MKIGKFKFNDIVSYGAVYDDSWIDIPGIAKIDTGCDILTEFVTFINKSKEEMQRAEKIIHNAFMQKGKYANCIHKLEDSTILPPVPEIARLFTMRGNGALSTRAISLRPPCHPCFDVRYTHNFVGHNSVFNIASDFEVATWNLELIAVISKECKEVSKEKVYDYIAGYTLMMDHAGALKNYPFLNEWSIKEEEMDIVDWFYFDSFNKSTVLPCPIGPWITTSDEIDNPHDLWLTERERGRLISKAHTSAMLCDFSEIISFMSQIITLRPGDLISCSAIGFDGYKHWDHYTDGDYVEGEAEKIGKLRMIINDERGMIQ